MEAIKGYAVDRTMCQLPPEDAISVWVQITSSRFESHVGVSKTKELESFITKEGKNNLSRYGKR
ncbi:hypothetical protein PRBEI_2000570500 [Prionailurus iriomotensis]